MTSERAQASVVAGAATRTSASMPDVRISAAASATEVRVGREPRVRSRLWGDGVLRDDVTRRENLPARLRAGERREHVRVRRDIAGRVGGGVAA